MMLSQPMLDGLAEGKATDRLFFAVYPDKATATLMAGLSASLRQAFGLGGKPIPPERLHITLHHLGDYVGLPAAIVAAASRAGGELALPSFIVTLDHAASFYGRSHNRPFVLRGADSDLGLLHELHRALGDRLAAHGLGRYATRTFAPHLTLLYDDKLVPALAIEPIRWTVREFVLVHSLLGRGEHRILQRWRLGTN